MRMPLDMQQRRRKWKLNQARQSPELDKNGMEFVNFLFPILPEFNLGG